MHLWGIQNPSNGGLITALWQLLASSQDLHGFLRGQSAQESGCNVVHSWPRQRLAHRQPQRFGARAGGKANGPGVQAQE